MRIVIRKVDIVNNLEGGQALLMLVILAASFAVVDMAGCLYYLCFLIITEDKNQAPCR
jgi:hypothetical protein